MTKLFSLLSDLNINYDSYKHDPVYTCDEVKSLPVKIKGIHTKNLFLRDDKGRRHFLVVLPADKSIALKDLSERIGAKRLGFASPDRLKKFLGIEPGAVSPLAIVNDLEKKVEVFFDASFKDEMNIQCHPLVNTATIILAMSDIEAVAASTGHEINFITL